MQCQRGLAYRYFEGDAPAKQDPQGDQEELGEEGDKLSVGLCQEDCEISYLLCFRVLLWSINSLYAVQNLRQQVNTDKGDNSVKDLVMLGC